VGYAAEAVERRVFYYGVTFLFEVVRDELLEAGLCRSHLFFCSFLGIFLFIVRLKVFGACKKP